MTTRPQDHAAEANHRLIAQVAGYYNDARENIVFYQKVNSTSLQEMSHQHLQHWKSELKALIFNGLNCADERSA